MRSEITTDINVVIENEKRELTREYFSETWDELMEESVSPSVIAEIFLERTLRNLALECGPEKASQMLEHFKQLDAMGCLQDQRTIQ